MRECVGVVWGQRKWSLEWGGWPCRHRGLKIGRGTLILRPPFALDPMPHSSSQADASFLPTHSIRSYRHAAPSSL